MNSPTKITALKNMVKKCGAAILYSPLENEVSYQASSFPIKIPPNQIILPATKSSDPFGWASKCTDSFKDTSPYILIPGTKFDLLGTRHGHGLGWYDRFLSQIPKEWLRVGITYQDNLSLKPLTRKAWDEPVDWLIALEQSTLVWEIYQMPSRLK